MGHGADNLALKFLRFDLMARAEIERHDHPQQPPQRFGHQCDALHPFGKPQRFHHGRDEQPQRAKGQHRARQAVQPVDKAVKPALARHGIFRAELAHRLHLHLVGAGAAGLGVFAEHFDRVAHHVAAVAEQQAKHPFNHPHTATRALNSAVVM